MADPNELNLDVGDPGTWMPNIGWVRGALAPKDLKVPISSGNPPAPDGEDLRLAQYNRSRAIAQRLVDMRIRNAASDMPQGSTTQFLGVGGQPLGPRTTDEFGIPL